MVKMTLSNSDFSTKGFPRINLKGIHIGRKVGPIEDRFFNLGTGTTVVYGKNGAGKSSLLNALSSVSEISFPEQNLRTASTTAYFTAKCPLVKYEFIEDQTKFYSHNPWLPFYFPLGRNSTYESRYGHWSTVETNPSISQDDVYDFSLRVERSFWNNFAKHFDELMDIYFSNVEVVESTSPTQSEILELKSFALRQSDSYDSQPTAFLRRFKDWEGEWEDRPFSRVCGAVTTLAAANFLWKTNELFDELIDVLTRVVLRGEMSSNGRDLSFVCSPNDSSEGRLLLSLGNGVKSMILADEKSNVNSDDWGLEGEEFFGGLSWEIVSWLDDESNTSVMPHHHAGIEIQSGVRLPTGPVRILKECSSNELPNLTITEVTRQLSNNHDEDDFAEGYIQSDSLLIEGTQGSFAVSDTALSLSQSISELATQYFHRLMQSSIVLNCVLNPINRWHSDGVFVWRFLPSDKSAYLSFELLSNAELRWACVAVQLALFERQEGASILVIDEPESGLHRRAERFLAQGLHNLTSELGIQLVVATHSPSFLKLAGAQLTHIHTTADGMTEIEDLNPELSSRIEDFGLDKSDLLQLCRLFVVVEGLHDEIVLKELFARELSNAGIEVFSLRGLKNLKNSSDAQLLFKFTDANVIYVTDNENGFRIEEIWSRAQVTDHDQQLEVLSEITLGRKSNEAGFLKEFMKMALDMNSKNRMHFAALDAPDILEYLPLNAFTDHKSALSWTPLREEFATVEKATDFKKWLSEKYQFDFSEENVREACLSLDHIHSDLTSLLTTLLDLANI